MIPGAFEYYAPRSLGDAVKFLSEHKDDVKILSGGQSLLPLMKMRLSKPAFVVDIGRIPGLDMISEEGDRLIIGGLVTHAQIESSDLLKTNVPCCRKPRRPSPTFRCATAAPSAAASPTPIRPAIGRRLSWRSTRKSKSPGRAASVGSNVMSSF